MLILHWKNQAGPRSVAAWPPSVTCLQWGYHEALPEKKGLWRYPQIAILIYFNRDIDIDAAMLFFWIVFFEANPQNMWIQPSPCWGWTIQTCVLTIDKVGLARHMGSTLCCPRTCDASVGLNDGHGGCNAVFEFCPTNWFPAGLQVTYLKL